MEHTAAPPRGQKPPTRPTCQTRRQTVSGMGPHTTIIAAPGTSTQKMYSAKERRAHCPWWRQAE